MKKRKNLKKTANRGREKAKAASQSEQRVQKIEPARVQPVSPPQKSNRHTTRVNLSRFDDKPFLPPAEDPTLEELFGPLAVTQSEAELQQKGEPKSESAAPIEAPDAACAEPLQADSATPEGRVEVSSLIGSENTGPLPTLEELFGSEAMLAAAAEPEPELQPARKHRRLRGLFNEFKSPEQGSSPDGTENTPNNPEQSPAAEPAVSSEIPAVPESGTEESAEKERLCPERKQSAESDEPEPGFAETQCLQADQEVRTEQSSVASSGFAGKQQMWLGLKQLFRAGEKDPTVRPMEETALPEKASLTVDPVQAEDSSQTEELPAAEETAQAEEASQIEKLPAAEDPVQAEDSSRTEKTPSTEDMVQTEEAVSKEESGKTEEELLTEDALLFDARRLHCWLRGALTDLGSVFQAKNGERAQTPADGEIPAKIGMELSPSSQPGDEPDAAAAVDALMESAEQKTAEETEAASPEETAPETELKAETRSDGIEDIVQKVPSKAAKPKTLSISIWKKLKMDSAEVESDNMLLATEAEKVLKSPITSQVNKKQKKKKFGAGKSQAAGVRAGQEKSAATAAELDTEEKTQEEVKKKNKEASSFAEPVLSASVKFQGSEKGENKAPQPEPAAPELPEEELTIQSRIEEAYRYYAKPLDHLSVRLILTGLLTLLSLFFTLYLSQNWSFLPQLFSSGTTDYVLLVLLLGMVLVNHKLYFLQWRGKHGLRVELLISVATLFTGLDCVNAAESLRTPYPVVVGILLMIDLWGSYDRGLGMLTTLKVLREEKLVAGVSEVPELPKGQRGLVRSAPDVEAFLEKLQVQDLVDRTMSVYTPVALVVGLLLTLFISLQLKQDPCWTGSLIFLGSVPVMGLLAYPRLFYQLAERLGTASAALCGYHGAQVFGGEHSILIGDEDVFPKGSLSLNGFKVYNGNPSYVIALAAAAFRESGSALNPVFEDLLVTHNGRRFQVDNFRFYDSGGIGASIRQDVVLLGSLEFMRRMGVHMDRGVKVKQAVYMSLNGELAAVFAVRYLPPENLSRGLSAIAGNRHFKGILVTRTFLGTPGFIKAKFGIPSSAFLYPGTMERVRLSESEIKRSGPQGAILAEDSFSGFAQAAAGGRMLCSATVGAALLAVLGGVGGLLLMAVLAAMPAYETATALNIAFYVSAWLVPTLLLTAWGRHF